VALRAALRNQKARRFAPRYEMHAAMRNPTARRFAPRYEIKKRGASRRAMQYNSTALRAAL